MRRASNTIVMVRATACGATLLALLVACGSRGPLDDDAQATSAEAGVLPEGGGGPSGEGGSTADGSTTTDSGKADSGKPADASKEADVFDCAKCLFEQCGTSIQQCVQTPSCVQTFQCVIQDCLGAGGAPNPACLLKCASGDPKGALQIFQVFQCVTGTCGPDCGSLLSGVLGGLGGGGGGGGGKPDAGKKPIPKIAQAFSRWPELMSSEMSGRPESLDELGARHTP